jgi:hypothetical protein
MPDMVHAMRSYENVRRGNAKEWLQSNACELGVQHMTNPFFHLKKTRRVKMRVERITVK